MALQAPENISINQKGSQLDISPSTCLCHSNRARSLSWIFWTLLSSSRKEAGPHYSPGSKKSWIVLFPRLDWVTYSHGQVQIKWNLLIPLFQPRSRGSSHGKEHFQDAVGPTQAKISK